MSGVLWWFISQDPVFLVGFWSALPEQKTGGHLTKKKKEKSLVHSFRLIWFQTLFAAVWLCDCTLSPLVFSFSYLTRQYNYCLPLWGRPEQELRMGVTRTSPMPKTQQGLWECHHTLPCAYQCVCRCLPGAPGTSFLPGQRDRRDWGKLSLADRAASSPSACPHLHIFRSRALPPGHRQLMRPWRGRKSQPGSPGPASLFLSLCLPPNSDSSLLPLIPPETFKEAP